MTGVLENRGWGGGQSLDIVTNTERRQTCEDEELK